MKQFTDSITGKKFVLGKRGAGALNERVMGYVEERKQAGVNEVAIAPTKMKEGDTFKCDVCKELFTFDGNEQAAFISNIMEHGRGHGVCQILPVI